MGKIGEEVKGEEGMTGKETRERRMEAKGERRE